MSSQSIRRFKKERNAIWPIIPFFLILVVALALIYGEPNYDFYSLVFFLGIAATLSTHTLWLINKHKIIVLRMFKVIYKSKTPLKFKLVKGIILFMTLICVVLFLAVIYLIIKVG